MEHIGRFTIREKRLSLHRTLRHIARVIDQPFEYEARPPEEFLATVLKAGGEPAYTNCVYNSFARLSRDGIPGSDRMFENFTEITGMRPTTIEDFVRKHADHFRY